MKPGISILLTNHNDSRYLNQSICSVLNQSYKEFEFVIVDDGSTDDSESMIKSFDDERIRFFKKEHTGLADSLNKGMELASGDWIARMDADDIWHPEKLMNQMDLIKRESDLITSFTAYFERDKIKFIEAPKEDPIEFKKALALHPFISHPSVLYNRKLIMEHGGYNRDINSGIDYDLWLRIKDDVNVKVFPRVLVYYRLRSRSMSRRDRKATLGSIYKMLEPYYSDLGKEFGIQDPKEQSFTKGWREYFYGDPAKARGYWTGSGLNDIRVITAGLLSFLPDNIFDSLRDAALRPRLKYLFSTKIGLNDPTQKEFKTVLNSLNTGGVR